MGMRLYKIKNNLITWAIIALFIVMLPFVYVYGLFGKDKDFDERCVGYDDYDDYDCSG